MTCAIVISTLRAGQIARISGSLGEDFQKFGPWYYRSVVQPGEVQDADGGYMDTLSIRFECNQIMGRSGPHNVLAEVDTVAITFAY